MNVAKSIPKITLLPQFTTCCKRGQPIPIIKSETEEKPVEPGGCIEVDAGSGQVVGIQVATDNDRSRTIGRLRYEKVFLSYPTF